MTRAELYVLVWEQPMTKLAKKFGLSDVGLRKLCTRHNIPTPPLGYWAKLAHGKRVYQPALPQLKTGQSELMDLSPKPIANLPDVAAVALQVAIELEATPEKQIAIPSERPTRLREVAATVGKALRKGKPDHHGLLTFLPGYWPGIYVAAASIDRVELLIDTLARELGDRGYSISLQTNDIRLVIDKEPFSLRIYELKDKSEHVPTREDLKRQAEYEARCRQYPTLYTAGQKVWSTWDYSPSGRLAVEITDAAGYRWQKSNLVGRWYDRRQRKLEEHLGEMLVALLKGAAVAKQRRLENEDKARLEQERRESARKEQERLERAKKRQAFLVGLAEDYAQYRNLAGFAEVLNRAAVPGGVEPVDRIARIHEEMVVELGKRFSRDKLSAEISRLDLFAEDD